MQRSKLLLKGLGSGEDEGGGSIGVSYKNLLSLLVRLETPQVQKWLAFYLPNGCPNNYLNKNIVKQKYLLLRLKEKKNQKGTNQPKATEPKANINPFEIVVFQCFTHSSLCILHQITDSCRNCDTRKLLWNFPSSA